MFGIRRKTDTTVDTISSEKPKKTSTENKADALKEAIKPLAHSEKKICLSNEIPALKQEIEDVEIGIDSLSFKSEDSCFSESSIDKTTSKELQANETQVKIKAIKEAHYPLLEEVGKGKNFSDEKMLDLLTKSETLLNSWPCYRSEESVIQKKRPACASTILNEYLGINQYFVVRLSTDFGAAGDKRICIIAKLLPDASISNAKYTSKIWFFDKISQYVQAQKQLSEQGLKAGMGQRVNFS